VRWRHGTGNWLAYSPDGKTLYSSALAARFTCSYVVEDLIRQWDPDTGRELSRWQIPGSAGEQSLVAVNLNRRLVAFSSCRNDRVTLMVMALDTRKTLLSVPGAFTEVTFSPRGNILAAWGVHDFRVHVWDLATGRELRRLDSHMDKNNQFYASGGQTLAVSPDERFLASIVGPPGVHLWELATGRETLDRREKADFLSGIAFSPDGKTLAWSRRRDSRLGQWEVCLWDVAGTRERHRLSVANLAQPALAFAPDGTTLATGTRALCLWDVASGKQRRCLPVVPPSNLRALAFSPDGMELAALAGNDSDESGAATVRRWNLASGCERTLDGVHYGPVWQIAFAPDGKRLASLSVEGMVCLWDARTGKPVWHEPGNSGGWERGLAVANDGSMLATVEDSEKIVTLPDGDLESGDKTVVLRDLNTGRKLRTLTHQRSLKVIAFPPQADVHLSVTAEDRTHRWDRTTGKPSGSFLLDASWPDRERVGAYEYERVYSPNGRFCAALPRAGFEQREKPPGEPAVLVADLLAGERPPSIRIPPKEKGRPDELHTVGTFSDDGKSFLLALAHPSLDDVPEKSSPLFVLIETATGQERARLATPGVRLNPMLEEKLVFTTDGRLVAFANERHFDQRPIRVWDAVTGKVVGRFRPTNNVCCLAFAPDGQTLASGLADSTVLLWDLGDIRSRLHDGPAEQLSNARLEKLWADLADADARNAYRAIHELTAAGPQAVAFLRRVLRPAPAPDARRIDQLVAELDSSSFAVREQASRELAAFGPQAGRALRKVLAGRSSLELRRRTEDLLDSLRHWRFSADELQGLRAVEVLEHVRTPEARAVLTVLAEGGAEARLTWEARVALERLERRHAPASK
jgi:WD40 repeat protein